MVSRGQFNPKAASEKIEGSVERVTYHNEETGFCVLRVQTRGRKQLATIVGQVPHIVAGEWVQAEGSWIIDRKHGRQFKAAQLSSVPPESLAGIEKFLASGLIHGIGPVYAKKLVERFGREVFDIIEKKSAALEKVEGIGRVRRQRIKDSWIQTQAVRSIMAFLMGHGVSTARAFRIYKKYGEDAIKTVREDPYCLCRDIRGIGFKTADTIAQSIGISEESDLRARAGVEYVLQEVTTDGHCAYPLSSLIDRAQEILNIGEEIIQRAVEYGVETGRLVREPVSEGRETLIFLASLFHAEQGLVRRLMALREGVHPCPGIDVQKAIGWVEDKIRLELASAQRDAIQMAVRSKVMVITGGPGVGKTTLINAVIRILSAKKLHVVMCAPTGRAAKRLSETTGRPAKTIHRLLQFLPAKGRFEHDEKKPLKGDVFVIDESSMIDLPLAWSLIRAIPLHAAVIFVGDVDQLPSVGPGNVLKDIIQSQTISLCRLTEVFRQAAESEIITNAHRILHGQMPELAEPGTHSDFHFIEAEEPEKAAERIVNLVRKSIPSRLGFDPIEDVQVLCPMRRGALGSHALNDALQAALNSRGEALERFGFTYRVGDKVMQQSNDYDKDVFNGDVGRVARIDVDNSEMLVCFDGRDVRYDIQELDELLPSYAVTIHKSQGSEYPCVVLPIHTQHFIMLQRNLLYTAVTRGKRMVIIVGTKKALAIAVKRSDARRRITTLAARLRTAAEMMNA